MRTPLNELLGKELLFLDGGTGTVLQAYGIKPGELSETWNLKHPDKIVQLHYEYYKAGSNIVYANTFGAYDSKFPLDLERIIVAGIANINEARRKVEEELAAENGLTYEQLGLTTDAEADQTRHELTAATDVNSPAQELTAALTRHYVAFDMSSTGKLLKPMGDLDFEDAVKIFKKTALIALKQEIDCFVVETMNDGYETKACILAVKEAMEETGRVLPILCTNVYDQDCRTLSGSTPETMVAMLEGLGVSALGLNCSLGPRQMFESVQRLVAASSVPVIVKPNAGLPKVVDGKTVFDVTPEEFVEDMKEIVKMGASIIGGCCGTTPDYIRLLKKECGGMPLTPRAAKDESVGVISSNTKVVYFGGNNAPVLIGERINPTGKKKFKEALRNNDIPYIIHQGMEQEQAGAHVLDVNVGLPEIDEKEMMVKVMTELQSVTDLPLQIDTTSRDVMEAALRRYNGKPLINSVNGKKEVMDQIFPLAKKYGGVIIGLTLDEDGIPNESAKRIEIAKKIYAEAEKYGIPKKDIIIDPLAMAVSSDSTAGIATAETVRAIHDMGGNTSLGISNVSFGLPNREFVTSTFFTMCMTNGLSAAIMNPLQFEMMKAYKCFCLLNGKDDQCLNYLDWASKVGEVSPSLQPAVQSSATPSNGGSTPVTPPDGTTNGTEPSQGTLEHAIIHGLKEDSAKITAKLLENTESLEIINNHLIPGLDYVGKRFEKKTMYLPQLLMAAEAAKSAFGEIRQYMDKTGKKGESRGTIIIATVKGDIHDIGKNIVKVLLENYDFNVIDLGKDVPPETVVEACIKDHVELIGLSALMTTTVAAMEDTIKLVRQKCPWAKVCVGGAVLTQEYSDMIGADFYGKDAMDTVRYAMEVFKK